jgi:hypothetical protein
MKALAAATGTMNLSWAATKLFGWPRKARVTMSMAPVTSMHLAMMNMTATVTTPVLEKPASAGATHM